MSFFPADSKIYAPLFSDPEVAEIFSDEQFVRCMLDVEAALARVQSRLDVIPAKAGEKISAAAAGLAVDIEELQAGTERAGFPVIALVEQLRKQVGGDEASYVHWGATTQDIMDTALVLQIRSSLGVIGGNLRRLIERLAALTSRYRDTLMAGRTHSQQALPIPLGLKIAGWLAPLLRHRQRMAAISERVLVVQFGGAAGTLASLGESGASVQVELARELDLGVPLTPWHTQRDNLAELAGWLALVTGGLAKMGQDIILLAQTEVAEVRETDDPSRGGSSTMPQKNNPILSEGLVAAGRANASLLASMHQALVQEHERATHGWQLEWLTLPQMFALTASALKRAVFLSENLVVDEGRMRQNVASSNGLMLAEAVTFALAPSLMSRSEAKELVAAACRLAADQDRHLVDVVREQVELPSGAEEIDWEGLREAGAYLGSADSFIDRVLQAAESEGLTASG